MKADQQVIVKENQRSGMKEKSSVAVEKATRLRLDKMGLRGESFDALINRLLDELEDLRKKQQQKK
jgi:hypothetical protein